MPATGGVETPCYIIGLSAVPFVASGGAAFMTSALFSPIRLAGLDLANRIVVSPMCQYSANDGVATDWHFTHLGTLANSGAALVVVEATGTERRGRITHGCLGLYSDDCEAGVNTALAMAVATGMRKSAFSSPMPDARRPPSGRGRGATRSMPGTTPGRPSLPPPFRLDQAGTSRAPWWRG